MPPAPPGLADGASRLVLTRAVEDVDPAGAGVTSTTVEDDGLMDAIDVEVRADVRPLVVLAATKGRGGGFAPSETEPIDDPVRPQLVLESAMRV